MKMKQSPDYHQNLARLAVIQQLRSYGIKIKHWNSKQRLDNSVKSVSAGSHATGKIFGSPINVLPQLCIPNYGNIPVVLAEVCTYLKKHVDTEGLFRKSGSVARQKLLKAKLDKGDNDLSDTPPCDVAGILKQFFRELPDPILPADLQDALCKAQQLSNDEEKASATMLISCLMPEQTVSILRYFFNFLQTVSMKSDLNKMDSSNLAVIFAPNLLQSEDAEKISGSTEKKLRTQAAIVRVLIDQAADIGCVPDFLLDKIPGMLGVDICSFTPGTDLLQEGDETPGEKKRRRRSVGVLSSMVTPLILTPSSKRKLPLDSVQGISNKKRKSIKYTLTFGGSTPSSVRTEGSPSVFETSENAFSPSISSSNRNLRRSKRYENKRVQRVESGKTGCFSPKISRKEMVRRSLRLRFSLGKSNKDVSASGPFSVRSQNIGWRLANSQELPATGNKGELQSSPDESPFVSAGSKKMSKSEDNLLTPKKSSDSSHRMSWTGPPPMRGDVDGGSPISSYLYTGNCYSEPFLVSGKPPAMPQALQSLAASCGGEARKEHSLCEDGECQAQDTVRKITEAFTESGSDLHAFVGCSKSLEFDSESQLECEILVGELGNDGNNTHSSEPQVQSRDEASISVNDSQGDVSTLESLKACNGDNADTNLSNDKTEKRSSENICIETKINSDEKEMCVESPVRSVTSTARTESSPVILKIVEDSDLPCGREDSNSSYRREGAQPKQESDLAALCTISGDKPSCHVAEGPVDIQASVEDPNKEDTLKRSEALQAPLRRSIRVSDHIQHFNRLCLNDRGVIQKVKSPIKLQRTPVRQSIRRINSLLEVKQGDQSVMAKHMAGSPMVKSVSCDGTLSSELPSHRSSQRIFSTRSQENSTSCELLPVVYQAKTPRVPRESCVNSSMSTKPTFPIKSVLEDLTNQGISRPVCPKPELGTCPNNALRNLSNKEPKYYRGSPKNPIVKVSFLPASRPLDL